MRLLLDTNEVIGLLGDPAGPLAQRIRRESPGDIGLSAVVLHELYYGAYKSRRVDHNLAVLDTLMLEVVPFDREDARSAGLARAVLARQGTPIGPFDILIAGQALARNLILVTNNLREFQRVPDLRCVDWRSSPS